MKSKHTILIDMMIEEGKILASLGKLRGQAIEMSALVPEPPAGPVPAPVEPDIPEVPVEPDTPEGPSAPAVGPEDRILGKLTGDMTKVEVATAISEARPGTTFECFGSLPTIRIGGILGDKPGRHNEVAYHADGSPITDIDFEGVDGGPEVRGLLLHNSLGGFDNVEFRELGFRPRMDGDRAAILCEQDFHPEKHQGGMISLVEAYVYAPQEWTAWDGYGYKQGIVLRSSAFNFLDVRVVAPREHGAYLHNIMGDSHGQDYQTTTREVNGYTVGCGRSAIQIQERKKDGLESYGDISFNMVTGNQCCSEGVIKGLQGSGGAAFTLGGHNGKVTYKDCHAVRPMSGMALAVWAERENNGDLKGYREPAINELELDGFTWSRGSGLTYGTRTPMKISNVHQVGASRVTQIDPDMQVIDPWLDSRVKLNDSPSDNPLTPERVFWT